MGGYFAGIMNDEDRHGNGEAHGAGIEHPGGGSGGEQYRHGGQGAGGGACGDVGTVCTRRKTQRGQCGHGGQGAGGGACDDVGTVPGGRPKARGRLDGGRLDEDVAESLQNKLEEEAKALEWNLAASQKEHHVKHKLVNHFGGGDV